MLGKHQAAPQLSLHMYLSNKPIGKEVREALSAKVSVSKRAVCTFWKCGVSIRCAGMCMDITSKCICTTPDQTHACCRLFYASTSQRAVARTKNPSRASFTTLQTYSVDKSLHTKGWYSLSSCAAQVCIHNSLSRDKDDKVIPIILKLLQDKGAQKTPMAKSSLMILYHLGKGECSFAGRAIEHARQMQLLQVRGYGSCL